MRMDDKEIFLERWNRLPEPERYAVDRAILDVMAKAREDECEKHIRITVDESAQPELRAWFKKELEDAKKQERERIFKELDKLIKYKDAQGEWCDYKAIKKLKAKLKSSSDELDSQTSTKFKKEGSG